MTDPASELGNARAIQAFVQRTLECSCPQEVFQRIAVRDDLRGLGIPDDGYGLDIGGRLLLWVVALDDWESLVNNMVSLLQRGRAQRDQGGFNRFRLVVATPAVAAAGKKLQQQFKDCPGLDDHVHLHVLAPGQLPPNPYQG